MTHTQISNPKKSTIEFLLRRMQHKTDFPALSKSVSAINRLASSERESVNQLSNSILKDFSLTNKILRLVNTAHYRQAAGGTISTVSRAVLVLGFDTIRNMALAVMLFEHLNNKNNAKYLKEEFLRTNLAGILGRDISQETGMCNPEQAFICSMFCNLGRLLCYYYFTEESEAIRNRMLQKNCSEDDAMFDVMQISFEELGLEIARIWGFPPIIINSMRKLPPGNIRKPASPEERLQAVSSFANEFCDAIAYSKPNGRKNEIRKLLERFGNSVPVSEENLQGVMGKSYSKMTQFAAIINLDLHQSILGRQVSDWLGKPDENGNGNLATPDHSPSISILSEREPYNVNQDTGLSHDAETILTSGIQDISNTLVEEFKLTDVLRMIMETMYRAKGFRRVILCIRDRKHNTMVGRFGFGPDGMEMAKRFNFPITSSPNIFDAALSKCVDIMISDANDPKAQVHLPEWFMQHVRAETFLILPLCIKDNAVAMIYADRERAGDIVLPEKELSLLRTLRNQAVLAIKQSA